MRTYGEIINEVICKVKANAEKNGQREVPVAFGIEVLSIDLSKPVSSFNFAAFRSSFSSLCLSA